MKNQNKTKTSEFTPNTPPDDPSHSLYATLGNLPTCTAVPHVRSALSGQSMCPPIRFGPQ